MYTTGFIQNIIQIQRVNVRDRRDIEERCDRLINQVESGGWLKKNPSLIFVALIFTTFRSYLSKTKDVFLSIRLLVRGCR